jgi:hypothetical protein
MVQQVELYVVNLLIFNRQIIKLLINFNQFLDEFFLLDVSLNMLKRFNPVI